MEGKGLEQINPDQNFKDKAQFLPNFAKKGRF